jgi:hypothetical protein
LLGSKPPLKKRLSFFHCGRAAAGNESLELDIDDWYGSGIIDSRIATRLIAAQAFQKQNRVIENWGQYIIIQTKVNRKMTLS